MINQGAHVRVKDPVPVGRVAPVGESKAASAELSAKSDSEIAADKVTVDETRERDAATAEVRRQVGTIRQQRLVEIEAAVRNGTYRPDPRLIAERILQAAALDAQLSVMTRGVR
jgi:negative regulator of flagellin synthesis FlgM